MESTASFMAEQAAQAARENEARQALERGNTHAAPEEEMNGELFEEEEEAEPQPEMVELHGIAEEEADPDAPLADEEPDLAESDGAPPESESGESASAEG